MTSPEEQSRIAREAAQRLLQELFSRGGTGQEAFALECTQELASAFMAAGGRGQTEAEVTDVVVEFYDNAVAFACRLKIKGQAWPPRPPVDTRLSLRIRELRAEENRVHFVVDEPLNLSSTFAGILTSVLGKLARGLPIPIDQLKKKDSKIVLDWLPILIQARPDMADSAKHLRIYNLKASTGRIRIGLGFVKD